MNGYVFNQYNSANRTTDALVRTLIKQSKVNRNLTILLVAAGIKIFTLSRANSELKNKVRELSDRIKSIEKSDEDGVV